MPIFMGEHEDSVAKFKFDFEGPSSSQEFERKYMVISDYVGQDEVEIVNTTGIPLRFSRIGRAVCIEHEVKAQDILLRNPRTNVMAMSYIVTCKFTSSLGEQDIPTGNPDTSDPLAFRPKVTWKARKEPRVMQKDLDGKTIQTTGLEPLFYERPRTIPILTVKKIEVWPFPPLKMFGFLSMTNLTPFYGAPPQSCLMADITADEVVIDQKLYCDVSYEIEFDLELIEDPKDVSEGYPLGSFKPNTQQAHILNNGIMYIPDPSKLPTAYTDVHGIPQKINLSLIGEKLADDQPDVFLDFRTIPAVEFNALNLGPF